IRWCSVTGVGAGRHGSHSIAYSSIRLQGGEPGARTSGPGTAECGKTTWATSTTMAHLPAHRPMSGRAHLVSPHGTAGHRAKGTEPGAVYRPLGNSGERALSMVVKREFADANARSHNCDPSRQHQRDRWRPKRLRRGRALSGKKTFGSGGLTGSIARPV